MSAKFDVTVITRPDSASAFPTGLPVIRVDYSDVDALATALAGQGAVVCAIGPGAIGAAKGMVDAAARAGVKRYISEWMFVSTYLIGTVFCGSALLLAFPARVKKLLCLFRRHLAQLGSLMKSHNAGFWAYFHPLHLGKWLT